MEIDVKNCPCYIDRPLHRYDKGCLIQSQAFSEQQTKEKPILRCNEIVGCTIKEQYKQLQQLKAENEFKESEIDDWIKQYKLAHQRYMKLQTENEELKKQLQEESDLGHKAVQEEADSFFEALKYKQCLDEIEECLNQYEMLGKLNIKYLLQLIKQAKEENNEKM